MAVKV
jgi:hypothetical protein